MGDVRAVDVAVRRLREKIEDDPASPKFMVTKRGMGYLFGAEPGGAEGGDVLGDPPQGDAGGPARTRAGAEGPSPGRSNSSWRSEKRKGPPAGRVLGGTDPPSPKFVVTKRGMGALLRRLSRRPPRVPQRPFPQGAEVWCL